jgi:hypothetical protein
MRKNPEEQRRGEGSVVHRRCAQQLDDVAYPTAFRGEPPAICQDCISPIESLAVSVWNESVVDGAVC